MQRMIFAFQRGSENVFADPEVVLRDIVRACDFDLDGVLKLCKSENPAQSIPAMEKLLAAARSAFSLPPLNGLTGEGTLDDEADAILNSFWDFLEKKNAMRECSPTSPPAEVKSP